MSGPSPDLQNLLIHQKQIKQWLHDVKRKIHDLETLYLDDTHLGNIVKGWDVDGRPPISRVRGQHEDKERIFSCSVYNLEKKAPVDSTGAAVEKKPIGNKIVAPQPTQLSLKQNKKFRKRKVDSLDDWNQPGDY